MAFRSQRGRKKIWHVNRCHKNRAYKSIPPLTYDNIWSTWKLQEFHEFYQEKKNQQNTRFLLTRAAAEVGKTWYMCVDAKIFVLCPLPVAIYWLNGVPTIKYCLKKFNIMINTIIWAHVCYMTSINTMILVK